MVSLQVNLDVSLLNDKEKSAICEALNEAKCFLANKNANVPCQHQLALTGGGLINNQHRALGLYECHNYQGKFDSDPPQNGYGMFLHQGLSSQGNLPMVVGSKGALKYGHIDKLLNPRGYVIAWDNPDDASAPRKVCVIAGERSMIMAMSWNEIEQKLDASGSESCCPEAYAKIDNLGKKRAAFGALFFDKKCPCN